MKKAVWIALIVSLVLVNLGAWIAEQATGFSIPMILRLVLVLGITVGTTIFAGAFALVSKFDEERPLTGHGNDTLQQRPANQPANTGNAATPPERQGSGAADPRAAPADQADSSRSADDNGSDNA